MNDLCRNLAKDRQLKEYAIHLIDKYVDTLRKMGHDNVIGSYTGYEKIKNNVDEKCIQRLINHLKPAITTISNLEHENELNIYDQKESFYLKRFLNIYFFTLKKRGNGKHYSRFKEGISYS